MANAVLFIGWGAPVRGRERQSLEVFGQVMQYYDRLKRDGEIEDFEPVELEPHGGDLQGFVLMRGDRDKLGRLRYNDEFVHNINRATLVVEHVGVVAGYIGEGLNRLFADYGDQVAEFAQ